MKRIAFVALIAVVSVSFAADPLPQRVSGEKQDSGLGELPHYRHWIDKTGKNPMGAERVVGEKQDSGAGELPHYRYWVDKTGKDPMGAQRARIELAQRD